MKKVLITNYFRIKSSIQDDKINFELSSINNKEAGPFLGRSSINNGIVDYVSPKPNKINKRGVLTVALDGSTGSTFYQHHNFYSGQNIWILEPIDDVFDIFTPEIALFCVTTITKAVTNYSYNLSLTKKRLSNIEIFLPVRSDNTVDTNSILNLMNKLRNIELLKNINEKRII